MKLLFLVCLLLMYCILTNSGLSLNYASLGLELWFTKMIPTLLPFMILSGIMVRMHLTEKLAMLLYPLIGPVYRIRKNVCYCIMMGFLCGFPMGAKVVAELYEKKLLTGREAEYLLAFCNNIGPVYFCGFVLPLLKRRLVLPYLFGMYGIPMLYGLLLRYTFYRDLRKETNTTSKNKTNPEICCCWNKSISEGRLEQLLQETNASVISAVQSMLSLGGYMILFNLLNIIPHILLGHPFTILSPLLEISGGLIQLGASLPLYSLLVLSFGGFSCIAQTYSCISQTDLSIYDYILHKIILTLANGGFYLGWFLLFPTSFLL